MYIANNPITSSREDVGASSQPVQRKSLPGTSAVSIVSDKPLKSSGTLRAQLFDLADQDRECLTLIREKLDIDSNALAVRLSIRALARRLNDPARLRDPENQKPAQEGEQHG